MTAHPSTTRPRPSAKSSGRMSDNTLGAPLTLARTTASGQFHTRWDNCCVIEFSDDFIPANAPEAEHLARVYEWSVRIRAEFLLPVHHQTFRLSRESFLEPVERFVDAAGSRPQRVVTTRVGQVVAGLNAGRGPAPRSSRWFLDPTLAGVHFGKGLQRVIDRHQIAK